MSENNKQDEIDLIQLIHLIGNAFQRLFNFIGSIFGGLFDFFIKTIIYFKGHLIKIAIAGVVGYFVGDYVQENFHNRYESSMVVKPNFNSTRQLYANIAYYNQLLSDGNTDFEKLDSVFRKRIPLKNLKKIIEFKIEPLLE